MNDLTHIKILVVDDEEPFRKLLERNLSRSGATVRGAGSGEEALSLIRDAEPDLAILDISMPGIGGIELLSRLRSEFPAIEAIMLTGHATVETAIEAMKLGAYDYLEKPLKMSELAVVVDKALEKRRLSTENRTLKDELRRREPAADIVGQSRPTLDALALIERVAPTSAPVLILGESGTGKELAARAIHRRSTRADRPLIAINCGALQETLLENELFGHVRGAFTGATVERRGLFEFADRGTMFIDEVCEMGPGVQKKFLRVLENGEFRRLGDSVERKVDVRIVAATNRDMEREVAEGRFREDLFYRLNVVIVKLPPLRERKDDVPLLVKHFCDQYAKRASGPPPRIEPAAMEKLVRYDWPGNIRELFNILERGMIVSRTGAIGGDDIPDLVPRAYATPPPMQAMRGPSLTPTNGGSAAQAAAPANGNGAASTLDDIERQHVLRTIQSCGGNKTKAAMELGISLRALYRKLEKYQNA
jgi:DNA-binding NtrC family response regulator